jgi:S-formylglutathione hydrolase FrmB
VSAFAPIANPINCPWGQKAFKGYFGDDQQAKWKEHDATELISQWKGPLDVLIDVVRTHKLRLNASYILIFYRAWETISTNKSNFYLRTLWMRQRRAGMTKALLFECSQ